MVISLGRWRALPRSIAPIIGLHIEAVISSGPRAGIVAGWHSVLAAWSRHYGLLDLIIVPQIRRLDHGLVPRPNSGRHAAVVATLKLAEPAGQPDALICPGLVQSLLAAC